jgi:hypothetical protein
VAIRSKTKALRLGRAVAFKGMVKGKGYGLMILYTQNLKGKAQKQALYNIGRD